MENQTVVTILVTLGLIAGASFTIYLYLRNRTLGEIRNDVYQLFLEAEHRYLETEAGKRKMDFVIRQARSLLPTMAQIFITDDFLRKVVQEWFDAVKDLLDDGKYNNSTDFVE